MCDNNNMYFDGKRKFLAFHLAPGRSARDGEIFADIAMALASQKARASSGVSEFFRTRYR